MRRHIAVLFLAAGAILAASFVSAQSLGRVVTPVLTVESDRLFAESAFGQRVAQDIEAQQSVLLAENRKIQAELTAEERALTDKRATMPPDEFRAVADAFDERVQEIRRSQEAKLQEIADAREASEVQFIQSARPVLARLMREAGAVVILEKRAALLSLNSIDITDLAIERLNTAIGDGSDR